MHLAFAYLVYFLTFCFHWLARPFVSEEKLLNWKPIHLCWWFEKNHFAIPKYFIAGSSTSSSRSPSRSPSASPSASPSSSVSPSSSPSASPSSSISPSSSPSSSPSASPSSSISPSSSPSASPSISPSESPSPSPGWESYSRGNYATLPTSDTTLETTYSTQDYTDVSTLNAVRVSQTANGEYAIHQFKDYVGSATSCILTWTGQSTYSTISSIAKLQIYNRNSTTWDDVDSENLTDVNTNFTLSGTVADLTNYKDGNNAISCRVWQLGP